MGLHPVGQSAIPEATAKAAKGSFPMGNMYIDLRDRLDGIYVDDDFATLYPSDRGRPSYSPARLVLCLIVQFAENKTDREMADAVRARLDLKYLLGLELNDAGFHYSVLSCFRERLLEHAMVCELLDHFVDIACQAGLIKVRGRQRTDATHVLAAVRRLNRLECVGETMRNALNVLAGVAPDWLTALSPDVWYRRYGRRIEQHALPKSKVKREALAEEIGRDGYTLLRACFAPDAPSEIREIDAVEILRAVWLQQYKVVAGEVRWRTSGECPPGRLMIQSPYDVEAHYSRKKTKNTDWVGWKLHLTETCDERYPQLIINVETTPSTTPDVEVTATIHQHLEDKGLSPREHLVDSGYTDAALLVQSRQHGIELIGPVQRDSSWQARAAEGYDISHFKIDWEAEQAICPQGAVSHGWSESQSRGEPVVNVSFAKATCTACTQRAQCTRGTQRGRTLKLARQELHQARQQCRSEQDTPEFKARYSKRAAVEGAISQTVRRTGVRHSRYIGQQRAHLQHVLSVLGVNLIRLEDWWQGRPRAKTRVPAFAKLALVPSPA